jgi:hypothetical protein
MFGRRRHAAAVPAAPVPQLSEDTILQLVHEKVAELIGERGEWTVSRRSDEDTDTIFHTVLAQSVSLTIATALFEAKRRLEAGEVFENAERADAQHVASESVVAEASVVNAPTAAPFTSIVPAVEAETDTETDESAASQIDEPVAFGWEPAPITVWTDLRKPVTGEIPAILHRNAA